MNLLPSIASLRVGFGDRFARLAFRIGVFAAITATAAQAQAVEGLTGQFDIGPADPDQFYSFSSESASHGAWARESTINVGTGVPTFYNTLLSLDGSNGFHLEANSEGSGDSAVSLSVTVAEAGWLTFDLYQAQVYVQGFGSAVVGWKINGMLEYGLTVGAPGFREDAPTTPDFAFIEVIPAHGVSTSLQLEAGDVLTFFASASGFHASGYGDVQNSAFIFVNDFAFTPIPEPSAYAGMAGGLMLGWAVCRRGARSSRPRT